MPTAALPSAHAPPLGLANAQRSIASASSSPLNSQSSSSTIYMLPLVGRVVAHATSPTFSERKIDQIEARLGSIESLLRNLSSNLSSPSPDHLHPARYNHTPQTSNSGGPPASTVDCESSDEESAFGGDTGLTAQTNFASEFLENAIGRTSLRDVNPSIQAALSNLRQLVDMQTQRSISHGPRFPLQQPLPPGGLSQLPMPPVGTVVTLLKYLKGKVIPLAHHI